MPLVRREPIRWITDPAEVRRLVGDWEFKPMSNWKELYMPTSSSGHSQDEKSRSVVIDDVLWESCKKLEGHFGLKVIVINGDQTMVDHDMDFNQGGNHEEDPELIDAKHVCLDDNVKPREWPFILYHEMLEQRLMKAGKTYDAAHKVANDHERQLRKKYMKKPAGSRAVGYVEEKADKRCGTCEYFDDGHCGNKAVALDQDMTDKNGLPEVDAKYGCCDLWEAE